MNARLFWSVIAALLALSLFSVARSLAPGTTPIPVIGGLPVAELSVGTTTIEVEIASTLAARQQGLSGRLLLSEGRGMLFVFEKNGQWDFWMKGMHFPIDILWLDETGTIVWVEENLSPDTYPRTFHSPYPARFVLEVPAGYALRNGLTEGAEAILPPKAIEEARLFEKRLDL